MTINELQELKSISIEIMLNAIDNKDFLQFNSGLKLWHDITKQIKGRTATA